MMLLKEALYSEEKPNLFPFCIPKNTNRHKEWLFYKGSISPLSTRMVFGYLCGSGNLKTED